VRADYFSADVQALIEILSRHRVRYLLVGEEAVIYHGYPRLTGDVDFWYEHRQPRTRRGSSMRYVSSGAGRFLASVRRPS
jgi:hypothetical protein